MHASINRLLSLLSAFLFVASATSVVDAQDASAAHLKPGIVDTVGFFNTEVGAWRIAGKGWVPDLKVLVHFPDIASEDALMLQLKKGSKKIGKPFACRAHKQLGEYQENAQATKYPAHLAYFECRFDEGHAQNNPGSYSLDVSLRQTLLEKETKLGSLELEVINIKQGSQNTQQTLQNESLDALVGPAVLYEEDGYSMSKPSELRAIADGHFRDALKGAHNDSTHLNIGFWAKTKNEKGKARYDVACLHDGKKVASKPASAGGASAKSYWTFVGKTGKDVVQWKHYRYPLYDLRVRAADKAGEKPDNDQWHYLDQHPGKYECKVMADGAVQASFSFDVADGRVVTHACQKDVNTPDNVYIVPMSAKGLSDTPLNTKLQKRAFFRGKWSKGCPPR